VVDTILGRTAVAGLIAVVRRVRGGAGAICCRPCSCSHAIVLELLIPCRSLAVWAWGIIFPSSPIST